MNQINNNMVDKHIVEVSAAICGFITMMLVKIPEVAYGADSRKFVVGLVFTGIYAVVGWFIKSGLDEWKKRRNKRKG
jgi:hypothetical protein